MHNPQRGEIAGKIGNLSITLRPTFQRIARAEAVVGRSCFTIATDMGNSKGMQVMEMAAFLSALSKPKVERDDLGKAISDGGYVQAMELVGLACNSVFERSSGDDDLPGDNDLPGDDDEGKPED